MFKKQKKTSFWPAPKRKSNKKKLVGLGIGSALVAIFVGAVTQGKETHQ